MRAAAWLVACAALCALRLCDAEYHVGDFVPTARRAQFHGVRAAVCRSDRSAPERGPRLQSRTQWHDLLGRHCPKFGHSKTVRPRRRRRRPPASLTAHSQVAVPLPRPVGFAAGDEYKLALAFDGDRFLTQWLPVLGRRAPEVPLLQVELVRRSGARSPRCAHTPRAQTHTGGYISAVHASSQAVPASYLRIHAELIQVRPQHKLSRQWRSLRRGTGVSQQLALAEARAGALHVARGERGGQQRRPVCALPRRCVRAADARALRCAHVRVCT